MTKYILLLFLIMTLIGCGGFSLLPPIGSTPQTQTNKDYERIEYSADGKYPVECDMIGTELNNLIKQSEGKVNLTITRKSSERIIPKQTWWQRFCNWLSSLSWIVVILVIAAIATGNGWLLVSAIARAKKFGAALKETVYAIKKADAVKDNNELETALKTTQTKETKKVVAEMRAEL